LSDCGGGGSSGGGSSEPEYTYRVPEQIGDGLTTADLASKSVDVGLIEDMIRSIKAGYSAKIHSILIVLEGDLVLEEYFPGYAYMYNNFNTILMDYNRDTPHFLASATKSFVSALIGIALDMGLIGSLEESLYDFFPQYSEYNSPEKSLITLRHTLTMTAGLEWNGSYVPLTSAENDIISLILSDDWYGYILRKNIVNPPGLVFDYNNGLSILLDGVIRQVSGSATNVFAENYLFGPLGIDTYTWKGGPDGETQTSGGLYLRPREMAKFGLLYLYKGTWDSTQVVPEAWVDESTVTSVTFEPDYDGRPGYAYHWWRYAFEVNGEIHEAYAACGWGGQRIFVFSQLDMIIVFTAGDYLFEGGVPIRQYIKDYILPPIVEARSGHRR